ncbi:MAG: HAD-IC family P-type ATPase [Lachnospira sp.]
MTDVNKGLSTREVLELTSKGMSNIPVGNQSKSIGQIIAGNVFTYFNFVFGIFSLMLILVRSYVNMTFLPIIIINTIIGIVQEIRAKLVLDKLTVVNAPKTKVIRDGVISVVDSTTLVKGDICIFESGNQLSADAIVVEGNVRVNEALVTGESDEVLKYEGDILLSGSFVVSGECKAELTNVGHKAYAAKLALEAKAGKRKQQTTMMRSLDKMVKIIGVIIIPLGLIMYIQNHYYLGNSIKDSVVSVVASLVGMIPEGLYLLASVALVVSVMRLGRKRVLIHEMNCVETLARVNVLCVDKTGTITRPDMSVSDVVFMGENISRLIAEVAVNMHDDNETIKAVKAYFVGDDPAEKYDKAERVITFSSKIKYSGAVINGERYVFGAPEYVLLSDYSEYQEIFDRYSGRGERIIVFGRANEEIQGDILENPVTPLAFIILENEIRDTAKQTFSYFAEQGVDIVVISGDNPSTASNVAIRAGIRNAENYIDAGTLKTDEDIAEAVKKYTVFGRVIPEQKKKIIMAFKSAGKVVAMTGDGVNDVLALKCADCSVAMASGSEAASNAAQVVLLDSDFSKMPSVVLEGRRVVNNIQCSASLFLVKNIFSILTTFLTLIAANLYPLYPTQLSLLGAFTIGIPAFFLALQPNRSLIRGDFLVNVILKALPAGLTDFIILSLISIYGNAMGLSNEQISTVAISVLLVVGIATLVRVCKPWNITRILVCVAMTAGIFICYNFFKELFAIEVLTKELKHITYLLMLAAVLIFYCMCKLVGWIIEYLEIHNKRFRQFLKG